MICPVYTINKILALRPVYTLNEYKKMYELPYLLARISVDNITRDYTNKDLARPRADGLDVPELYEAGMTAKGLQVFESRALMSQDLVAKGDVARQEMFDSMHQVAEVVGTQDESYPTGCLLTEIQGVIADHPLLTEIQGVIADHSLLTEIQGVIADQPFEKWVLDDKDLFKDKTDQYEDNAKADLHNATEDHEMDTPMEEVFMVYIAYMLEVKDEEDRDGKEIVAKHMCGLLGRPVVSLPWESNCVARHQGHQRTQEGLDCQEIVVVKRKSKSK